MSLPFEDGILMNKHVVTNVARGHNIINKSKPPLKLTPTAFG